MFLNVPKCKIIAADRTREAPPRPATKGEGEDLPQPLQRRELGKPNVKVP